jgi:hypothetical protein
LLAWLKGPEPQLLNMYRVKNPINYFFTFTERKKKSDMINLEDMG